MKFHNFGALATLLGMVVACSQPFGPLNNPVDPKGTAYQGVPTVASASEITILTPVENATVTKDITLTATPVQGALYYEFQIATSDGFAATSLVLNESTETQSNNKHIWKGTLTTNSSKSIYLFARVRAIVGTVSGDWSPTRTLVWSELPSTLTLSATGTTVSASWTATSGGKYKLYYNTSDTMTGALLHTDKSLTTTSATIPNLEAGKVYTFFLYSVIQATGGELEVLSAKKTVATVPSSPTTAPTLGVGGGYLIASWTAVTGATGYKVFYNTINSTSGATPFASNPVTTTSATISGLTNGTKYYVFYSVVNDAGESGNSPIASATPASSVTTLAGAGVSGYAEGTGTAAKFSEPTGIVTDASGNVYLADLGNNRIRKITPTGVVTTLAGSGTAGGANGTGTAATFNKPWGLAIDSTGTLYVAENGGHRIRKITADGVVTTVAGSGSPGSSDGTGTAASFNVLGGIAVDSTGNLYVADNANQKIRKITPAGVVTTLAGSGGAGSADGTGTAASFNSPHGVAVDASGTVYVADYGNNKIRKITSAGVVTTLAGSGSSSSTDGTGTAASFYQPVGVALDAAGNLLVSERGGNRIRKVTPSGVVTTLAGSSTTGSTDGDLTTARFNQLNAITVDLNGNAYVGEYGGYRIRKITGVAAAPGSAPAQPAPPTVTVATATSLNVTWPAHPVATKYKLYYNTSSTFSGATQFGTLLTTTSATITGLTTGTTYSVFVVAVDTLDSEASSAVSSTPQSQVRTLAGSENGWVDGTGAAAKFYQPVGIAVASDGTVFVADHANHRIRKITKDGVVTTLAGNGTAASTNGTGTAASFNYPHGLAIDSSGNLYVTETGGNKIRKVTQEGVVTTLANTTTFSGPADVAVDSSGNVFVTENGSHKISKIAPDGTVTTVAGSGIAGLVDGTGTAARFYNPHHIELDSLGNLYVTDYSNGALRRITPAGVVSTIVGSGGIPGATGLALDQAGNLYVSNHTGHRIMKVTQAGGVTTLIGTGVLGFKEDAPLSAQLYSPQGLALTSGGTLYVGDQSNHRVRVLELAASPTAAPSQPAAPSVSVASPTSLEVSWVAHPAATGYKVYYATANSFSSATQFGGSLATTSTTITGLTTGTLYYVFLVATSSNGSSVASASTSATPQGMVTTLAGSGAVGSANGTGTAASFSSPSGLVVDSSGTVYVADYNNYKIRKITSGGVVTTLSGTGTSGSADGSSSLATFTGPLGMAFNSSTNELYIADLGSHKIRSVTDTGSVNTFAGTGASGSTNGAKLSALFNSPQGVARDANGVFYVADTGNHLIRKIAADGTVTTLAGSGVAGSSDGTGASATFSTPVGVAVDPNGNVYVADYANHKIRRISPAGVVKTLAGSGIAGSTDATGSAARFYNPTGIVIDAAGNLFVADYNNHRIRKVTPAGVVTTVAGTGTVGGTDATPLSATFYNPWGIALDGSGNLYVSDYAGQRVRKITGLASTGTDLAPPAAPTVTVASATSLSVTWPTHPVATGYKVYYGPATTGSTVADAVQSGTDLTTTTTTITGLNSGQSYKVYVYATKGSLSSVASEGVTATPGGTVSTLAGSGNAAATEGTGLAAAFNSPYGVAVDASGNVYVADTLNHKIRKITSGGVTSTFAGAGSVGSTEGTGATVYFKNPSGVAVDSSGNVYVADQLNYKIRKLTSGGASSTLAGSGTSGATEGTGASASFKLPVAVAVDSSGNIYVADQDGHKIRKITSVGVTSTLAGSGTAGAVNATGASASFSSPAGVAVDSSGNVYVADKGNNLIRKITSGGVVTTLAGSGTAGSSDGTGTAASFNGPNGISVDSSGNVYVTELVGNKLRKITSAGVVTTLAGSGTAASTDGTSSAAEFKAPAAVAIDSSNVLYVADSTGHKIRKVTQ